MIQNIKKFPKNSGVYFFRDESGKILYLGKAADLRNRIKSYFSGQKDQRISKMLETAKSIDWQETDSEIEALILELQFIKKYRPPFNIMLRDDKQYFYVVFTKEAFPKVVVVHRPPDKNFIGPFTDGTALRVTLKLLRRIFPYCTCKQKHNNCCLNYHIGNCPGFCCLNPARGRSPLGPLEASCEMESSKMPPEPLTGRGGRSHAFGGAVSNGVKKEATAKQAAAYRKNIAAIKEILNGRKTSLIKKMEKDMAMAAKKKDFEEAIGLRSRLEKVKSVFENSKIIHELELKNKESAQGLDVLKKTLNLPALPKRIEGYDVSNMQGEFATGAMAVFTDGQPDKNEYRKFRVRATGGDTGMLREIMTRRFNHPEWPYPDFILIDGGKAQLNAARSAILGHRKSYGLAMSLNLIPIIALTKDAKHKGHHFYASTKKSVVPLRNLPPAARNLILQIDAEAHRFAIGYYRKLHRDKFKK